MADESKPPFDRKPTFPVVVSPEDQEVLNWLDDKVIAATRTARATGAPVRGTNRSKIIWHLLRAVMEAERAALVSPPPSEKRPAKKPSPSRRK